jgi:hypothetical protein
MLGSGIFFSAIATIFTPLLKKLLADLFLVVDHRRRVYKPSSMRCDIRMLPALLPVLMICTVVCCSVAYQRRYSELNTAVTITAWSFPTTGS